MILRRTMSRIFLQKALENGVYVVGACGFDSIPADLGQAKTQSIVVIIVRSRCV